MLYQSQSALHGMCNAVWDGFERFALLLIQSRFDTNGGRFRYTSEVNLIQTVNKSELEEIPQWKSLHLRIACDSYRLKEFQPRRRKTICLSGGLITFSASWIRYTSSPKPARFEGKSGEPHSGTNRPVVLGNSEHGNSIIISGCQVSSSVVSSADFSLHWIINFRWASNRIPIEVKRLLYQNHFETNQLDIVWDSEWTAKL